MSQSLHQPSSPELPFEALSQNTEGSVKRQWGRLKWEQQNRETKRDSSLAGKWMCLAICYKDWKITGPRICGGDEIGDKLVTKLGTKYLITWGRSFAAAVAEQTFGSISIAIVLIHHQSLVDVPSWGIYQTRQRSLSIFHHRTTHHLFISIFIIFLLVPHNNFT